MTSQRKRESAAATAASNFTKYPRWLGQAGDWMPTSQHPLCDLARKQAWMQYEVLSPPEHRIVMPEAWTGSLGWYGLLRFVEMYLPPRPPGHHLLAGRHDEGGPVFYWKYEPPRRCAPLYADSNAAAVHDRFRNAPDRSDFAALPEGYFDRYPPRRPAWTEAGFVMPGGKTGEVRVRRALL